MAAVDMIPAHCAERAHGSRRLRILLSAYACEPGKGSEPGIGWQWPGALARAGHEVCVLTRANNRPAIENALRAEPVDGVQFVYYDLPAWMRWWKRGQRGVRLYYVLWQWGAYRLARGLCRIQHFDVVHHLTFGVYRHPSFMALLDVPFVFGPVGGGEAAPRSLRRTFPLRGLFVDFVRDVANRAVSIDPMMAAVYRRSAAILCKTSETLERIPARYRSKCVVQTEVGIDADTALAQQGAYRSTGYFHVLYVGRLVYWKGLHLGLMAFARFLETHHNARFTIIGSGPDEAWLRRLAQRLALGDMLTWIPWLDRSSVMRAYPRHDAFLFPSLHDSSGNAVLEALACGLPVVCLNIGGPGWLVDESCGYRVHAGPLGIVVAGLARGLQELARDPVHADTMRRAAAARAREHFSWPQQAARMESVYWTLPPRSRPGSCGVRATLERRAR